MFSHVQLQYSHPVINKISNTRACCTAGIYMDNNYQSKRNETKKELGRVATYATAFFASNFLLKLSGISGGGGRGKRKNTLTES